MPLYAYQCHCGKHFDRLLPLVDFAKPQFHSDTDSLCSFEVPATKLISAPLVIGDYAGYSCPVTGKWVEGRKAHRENLARTNCRILEPGETSGYKKGISQSDVELESALDTTADEFIAKLPLAKKEQLAAEMLSGASAEVVRSTVS